MRPYILIVILISVFSSVQAQDIAQDQVPSVILNNFSSQYPKANDIEWEKQGNQYVVEFEIGWNKDYEVWYDATGNAVKSKMDIAKKELPAAVSSAIKANFKGYQIEELEKVTSGGAVTYIVELDALMKEEWKVVFDEQGNILSKISD